MHSKVEKQPVTKVIERGTSKWPSAATGMFRWPLNSGHGISDRFGSSRGRGRTHGGVDIAAPGGTPIYAAASGTVVISQYGPSYGNYVKIEHSNGYATLAPASTLLVKQGQWVSKGQIIAKVGSTGNSTGNHLHFEVQRNAPHQPASILNPEPASTQAFNMRYNKQRGSLTATSIQFIINYRK